jgi:hypothetical protein
MTYCKIKLDCFSSLVGKSECWQEQFKRMRAVGSGAILRNEPNLSCSDAWAQQPLPIDRGGEGAPVQSDR